MSDGSQGNLGYVAMQPYIATDELLLISQADLLAVCEASQPTDCVTGDADTPNRRHPGSSSPLGLLPAVV